MLPAITSLVHPAASAPVAPPASPAAPTSSNPILAELQMLESFVANLQAMNSPAQQRILSFVASLFGASA